MDTIIQMRVQRGADLLDDKEPGWVKKVKPAEIDMLKYDQCVLGQLYGDYINGACILKLVMDQLSYYGFNVDYSSNLSDKGLTKENLLEKEELEQCWREAVIARP